MNRKHITIQDAKEVWNQMKNNEFFLIYYPTLDNYWRECERINNLPDNEWHKLINENQEKLKIMRKKIKQ